MKAPVLISPLEDMAALALSSSALAFVGDAVQTLYVRSDIVSLGGGKPGESHRLTSEQVRAGHQARIAEAMQEMLTDTEMGVYKRARNKTTGEVPKNADVADYRKATGLEALMGYLYLTGRSGRIEEILNAALSAADKKEHK